MGARRIFSSGGQFHRRSQDLGAVFSSKKVDDLLVAFKTQTKTTK